MATYKIGRYDVVEKLGSGGMAHVYLARDPYMKRDVAIKVMSTSLSQDPEFRSRFEREAEIIAALEHPYIVPVYDFGYHADQPFLVMRYLPGGSLFHRLVDYGPLSLSDAAVVVERMAQALEDAHTRGVVHRDFKPENILLDIQGDTFLSDFGIVKIIGTTGAFTGGYIAGTPAYMAPEQVHGELDIDPRADVYALGVSLFEMLCGQKPYQHENPTKLMMKHVLDPIPRLGDILPNAPTGISDVIMKAMSKSRDDRYASAAEFSEAVNAAGRSILSRRARKRWMADELADALDSLAEDEDDPAS